MKPRWKVIADYPCAIHPMGTIINTYESANAYLVKVGEEMDGTYRSEDGCLADYPAIFQKLEWWQERKIEEMPEYLKQTGMVDSFNNPAPDIVIHVKKHFDAGTGDWRDNNFNVFHAYNEPPVCMSYSGWEPATLSQYTTFINKSK
jgi:hypothetical protein